MAVKKGERKDDNGSEEVYKRKANVRQMQFVIITFILTTLIGGGAIFGFKFTSESSAGIEAYQPAHDVQVALDSYIEHAKQIRVLDKQIIDGRLENIEDDITDIKEDMKEILRRLPK